MLFQQKIPFRSTVLGLRTHGLYVCQRDGTGHVTLELEMPYEEMLPVRIERRRHVPRQLLIGLLLAALSVGVRLVQPLLHQADGPSASIYRWLIGLGLAGVGFFLFALRHWWTKQILHTARVHVVLADIDRAELRSFATALEQRTKSYLRHEYGSINPLGFIEPQLRRLHWLAELEVLSTNEVAALATRLTGRLSSVPLRSMGQELEAPYVN